MPTKKAIVNWKDLSTNGLLLESHAVVDIETILPVHLLQREVYVERMYVKELNEERKSKEMKKNEFTMWSSRAVKIESQDSSVRFSFGHHFARRVNKREWVNENGFFTRVESRGKSEKKNENRDHEIGISVSCCVMRISFTGLRF